jgi:hypothetical protein
MDLNAVAVDDFVNPLFAGGAPRLAEAVAAARSIRRQIVVAAEGLLDIYRCPSRRAIEYRWAEGRSERYAEIAAEFVRLKVMQCKPIEK